MTEAERSDDATLNAGTVGARLRAGRERLGLSLAEVASRTRVPLRHLEAIEAADFAGLPSVTYAIGFVRSYARAIGADEVKLAHDTRIEVANTVRPTPAYEPYEIADPKRVPSRGLVILATGLLIAVVVLAILWFATSSFLGRSGETAAPTVAAAPSPVPSPSPTPVAGGQVRLTANDDIWMKVYDAAGKTLYIGTLKPGESFDVPPDANNPMINIGRPDKLTVTLNGSAVAPLGTGERAIKDVPVGAAALAARAAGQPLPKPSPSASASMPAAFAGQTPRPRATRTPRPAARTLIRPSADSETRRANERSPAPEPTATASPGA